VQKYATQKLQLLCTYSIWLVNMASIVSLRELLSTFLVKKMHYMSIKFIVSKHGRQLQVSWFQVVVHVACLLTAISKLFVCKMCHNFIIILTAVKLCVFTPVHPYLTRIVYRLALSIYYGFGSLHCSAGKKSILLLWLEMHTKDSHWILCHTKLWVKEWMQGKTYFIFSRQN